MSAYLGIDAGGTNVRAALWDGDGEPRPLGKRPLPANYEEFLELISAFAQESGREPPTLAIALPARLHSGMVEWAPNIPYLNGKDLAGDVVRLTGVREARMAIDGQLALLGEARFGAVQGERNVLLVSIGTGVGGAIMCAGRLLRGEHGTAGAFGWLPSGGPDLRRRGSWEEVASGSALKERAGELGIAPERLADCARQGETRAQTVLDEFAEHTGAGLAGLASAFDVGAIVIGGGVSQLVHELLSPVQAAFERYASPTVRATRLLIARHPDMAGAFGAAVYAREGEGVFLQ